MEISWFEHAAWAERHRPTRLDQFVSGVLSEKNWALVQKIAVGTTMKSLLFYGPPGGGKTTLAEILVHAGGFPHQHFNGSLVGKERIRKIHGYLDRVSFSGRQKCIWINEADGITHDGQQAIRAMTEYMPNVAWVLTCNERRNLIPALVSRLYSIECRFPREQTQPVRAGILERCKQILAAEKVSGVTDAQILQVIDEHYPDIRSIINSLQMEFEPIKPRSDAAES
jgi:replication-associated recombination protein RarA